jgi:copper chaperone CopZ
MKRLKYFAPLAGLALCVASVSWAGGSTCTHDGASASTSATTTGSQCTGKSASTSTGGSCTMKGTSATAASQVCAVKSNQVIYSFAVPTAHCGNCVSSIQKVAMDTKGIDCVGFDLANHTAYVIADKSVSQKQVAKMIQDAGFKNKYTGTGPKVQEASRATGGAPSFCGPEPLHAGPLVPCPRHPAGA